MAASRLASNAARAEQRGVDASIASARLQIASAAAAANDELGTSVADITGGSPKTISDLDAEIAALAGSSSGGYTVAAHNATYSEAATAGEVIILASGTFTINLPTAVGNTAKLTVKLLTASTVTIDPAGTETIDGGATATIAVQYASLTFVSDGANWLII